MGNSGSIAAKSSMPRGMLTVGSAYPAVARDEEDEAVSQIRPLVLLLLLLLMPTVALLQGGRQVRAATPLE
jgi:hypothetical protein